MKPAEPFLNAFASERPEQPALSHGADRGCGESLVARIAAAGVLSAAVASIVWYVLETVLGL